VGGAVKKGIDGVSDALKRDFSAVKFSSGQSPNGSTLGLSTPNSWSGTTVTGPSGKAATTAGTMGANGQLTGAHAIGTGTQAARSPSPSRTSGGVEGGDSRMSGASSKSTSGGAVGYGGTHTNDGMAKGGIVRQKLKKSNPIKDTKMAKKRIPAEEKKEYKGGKYMGGPAEEMVDKKKKGKRMAMGGLGMDDRAGGPPPRPMAPGSRPGMPQMGGPGPAMGRMGGMNRMRGMQPGVGGNGPIMGGPAPMPIAVGEPNPNAMRMNPNPMAKDYTTAITRGMRGGGLAKKGVGQALAKGGLVKGAGCVQRGMNKTKYR